MCATVFYNIQTSFAKLQVGKHVVSAKLTNSSRDPLFPLTLELSDLPPLTTICVNYEPHPKNQFAVLINDQDYYTLIEEEVDFDSTNNETLDVYF